MVMLSSLVSFLLTVLPMVSGQPLDPNLPSCKGNDFELDFYMVDVTIRGLDNVCDGFQLATLGMLMQDIIFETELKMPEYKREYMRILICPFAEEEEEDDDDVGDRMRRRRLGIPPRTLSTTNRWKWKGRRATSRRCRNRATSRYLSATALSRLEHLLTTGDDVRDENDLTNAARRDLSYDSDDGITVDDVCAEVGAARYHQELAEKDLDTGKQIIEEMKEMSKDHWGNKHVKECIEDAVKQYDKISDKKDDTIKKVEDVMKQCKKAREKPENAHKCLKEAEKKKLEAEKKALEANEELAKLKVEEQEMLQIAEILGFDPALTEPEETGEKGNEASDIETPEEEVAEIEEQVPEETVEKDDYEPEKAAAKEPSVQEQPDKKPPATSVSDKATPSITDDEKIKLLQQKREEYLAQEQQLKKLEKDNQKYIADSSGARPDGSPAQIILGSYNGQIKGMTSWSQFDKTTSLHEYFEKFGFLLLEELNKGLPLFNGTALGCIDGPFGVIVNVTEVEGVMDDHEADGAECVEPGVSDKVD